jgi:molybdenum cofactor cytidylyltransferase
MATAPDRPDPQPPSGPDSGHNAAAGLDRPLVVLRDAIDDIESTLIVGLLRSEGIEALSNADVDPSIHPLGTSGRGSVLVLEQDLARARSILAERSLQVFAVAVILAAGQGLRMGQSKGMLSIGGRTLVEELVDTYSASMVRETVVVVAPGSPVAAMASAAATVLVNPDPARGPLSSLWIALDEIGSSADAILLHPVDVPVFSTQLVNDLITRYTRGEGPILVPVHDGRRGHPVLFGKQAFAALRRAPMDIGARYALHAHPELVQEVPTELPSVVIDLNTPDELQSFLGEYSPEPPDED